MHTRVRLLSVGKEEVVLWLHTAEDPSAEEWTEWVARVLRLPARAPR